MTNDTSHAPVLDLQKQPSAAVVNTAADAQAAKATALVQARIMQAVARPRDTLEVRRRLLKECARPGFAAVARYKVTNRGEGPSIRFAEAAVRAMGNLDVQTPVIYDDAEKRIINVSVTDLETNATYQRDVTVAKTVERRKTEGRKLYGTRKNSYGDTVYVVEATDEEILGKENAMVSKALRVLVLRHVPGDIIDDCMAAVFDTLAKEDAADPDAAVKKIADSFEQRLRVGPADLARYLGHPIGQSTPSEIAELRALFAALQDGQTSWSEALAERLAERNGGDAETEGAPAKAKRGTGALDGALRARRRAGWQKAEPAAPADEEAAERAAMQDETTTASDEATTTSSTETEEGTP